MCYNYSKTSLKEGRQKMLIYRSFLILGAKALKRTVNLNKFGKKVLVWISQAAEDGAPIS